MDFAVNFKLVESEILILEKQYCLEETMFQLDKQ